MAAVAKYRDDIAGAITTGGTSTAYTVSSYQGYDTLANMDGKVVAFTPHATNGGTTTLNVDGLERSCCDRVPSVELPAGTLILGTPYVATYNNLSGVWYLQSFFGNPYNIPIGGMLPFAGTTAPNSSFVFLTDRPSAGQPMQRCSRRPAPHMAPAMERRLSICPTCEVA